MSWPFLFWSNTMKSQMLWKSSCNGGPMFKLVLELLMSWDRAENTCNPIFVNGAFVALSRTTISPVGPITISLFISQLQPAKKYVRLLRSQFWCHRPFTKLIWTVIPQSFQGKPKSRPGVIAMVSSSLESQFIRKVVHHFRFFRFFFLQIKFFRPNGQLLPIACHTFSESY